MRSPGTTELFDQPATSNGATTARVMSKKRRLVVVPLAVIVITAWFIASFWTSVDVRSPRQPYLAPTAGQPWVRSPEAGPHAFFRLEFSVASLPQSATLWFDADQTAIPYVNGIQLASTPRIGTFTGSYIPRIVETLDIRPALTAGPNVIGLEVINYDNRPPAFQARIRLQTGRPRPDVRHQASDWSSTTNVGADRPDPAEIRDLCHNDVRARRLGARLFRRTPDRRHNGLDPARARIRRPLTAKPSSGAKTGRS